MEEPVFCPNCGEEMEEWLTDIYKCPPLRKYGGYGGSKIAEQIDELKEVDRESLTSLIEKYHDLGYWCEVDTSFERGWHSGEKIYYYNLKVFREEQED